MKKLRLKLISLLFLLSISMYAQLDKYSVMGIPTGTTAEINAVTPGEQGAVVYNTDTKKLMVFDGVSWGNSSGLATVKPLTDSYILTAADNGTVITINNSGVTTLTIPASLPIGFNISVYQIGTGQVTIAGASGVTLKNRRSKFKTSGKDAGVGVICTATNIFHLTGDLSK